MKREDPGRIVYAPNYWQWLSHQQRHGMVPGPLASCTDQLDMLDYLGVDVFSRNIYCDQRRCWFGGLASVENSDFACETKEYEEVNGDLHIERTYHLPSGSLTERQRHIARESTLVQDEFLVNDYETQIELLEELVERRRWSFNLDMWRQWTARVGDRGIICAGELFSPLKLLHLVMGPEDTTFFLMDEPERAQAVLDAHEEAQLDLVRQMLAVGVRSMMAMDNLDTVFHTPQYVEQYCASFYQRVSSLCHEYDSTFFIHACGHQKENLGRIASYGVDGLEGVAYPPLGNVELDEAFEATGDRFLITGGISAMETRNLQSRQAVFDYVGDLFERLRPYRHRFLLAASCNTAINASWQTLLDFRDAWKELGCPE
ncbi:MAG: hypothetical protein KJO79_07830 [Verrucomicrobiae bacterium]|nr:hypothetical protein [Verrucomicrobiae bacterium]NNJ87073.1 hypothetical protein [Akkermansiaceae bacterium]